MNTLKPRESGSIAPPSPRERDGSPDDQTPESENGEKRKQKEREAIRRKLELNQARRRSSMGRVSVVGGRSQPYVCFPWLSTETHGSFFSLDYIGQYSK
jgi:hypothetical protein